MKSFLTRIGVFAAGAGLLLACASFPQKEEMRAKKRVYDRSYDEVWTAAEDMLRRDLKCIFKEDDKAGGEIETEWVHRMDTEGKKRWMVRADIRRVKSGVEVTFYKKLDLQDDVSRNLERYKKKKNDTADTASSGWRKTDVDMTGVDELYGLLERRLDEQQ